MYKKYFEGKKVICFDLDGTIVDTELYSIKAFSNVLAKVNKDIFTSDIYGQPGEPTEQRWKRGQAKGLIKKDISAEQLAKDTQEEFLKQIKDVELEVKPGFWDLMYKIKEERKLPVVLATNSERAVAMVILKKLELDNAFDFMIFGDDVKNKKPDPEMYLKVAKHFKIKAEEMLVFDDSIAGTTAAAKAGASLIIIWDGQTAETLFPQSALFMTTDFQGIADNMDTSAEEEIENLRKQLGSKRDQQTQK